MSLSSEISQQVPVPLSAQYRAYFNSQRTDAWPESIRPSALSLVAWGEETIVAFETEIERLQTEENGVIKLLGKISLVAAGAIAACCNPLATLAGVLAGVVLGDKIASGISVIREHLDRSLFLKIATVTAVAITTVAVSILASHVLSAAFAAIALSLVIKEAAHSQASIAERAQSLFSTR